MRDLLVIALPLPGDARYRRSVDQAKLARQVQLHNRLEALLEEAHIKVSSLVSDLLGRDRASPGGDREARRGKLARLDCDGAYASRVGHDHAASD